MSATSYAIGQHLMHNGRAAVVTNLVHEGGLPQAVRVQYEDGTDGWLDLKEASTPSVRRAAPAPTSNEFARLADQMCESMKSYVDSRFADLVKYLPSGTEHRQEMVADISNEIERLLASHRKTIEEDVAYLRVALTRLDSLEARLKLLESPRSFQSNAA